MSLSMKKMDFHSGGIDLSQVEGSKIFRVVDPSNNARMYEIMPFGNKPTVE